jgi:hypothetical protein
MTDEEFELLTDGDLREMANDYTRMREKYKSLVDRKAEDFMLSAEADKARIAELESVLADIASGEIGVNLCVKYAKKVLASQSDREVQQ